MMLLDDFVVPALVAGIAVALVAGPLGCFIVWRRMAFFGATMSHAALLGVSLAFLLNINVTLGIIGACAVTAIVLLSLTRLQVLPTDALLGLLAHAALALGLVAISFQDTLRIDLMGLLFGDILSVSRGDLAWILGGGAAALGVLALIWRPLLSATVHEELAMVEGVREKLARWPAPMEAALSLLGQCAEAARAPLIAGDIDAIGEIMNIAHGGLCAIGVSTPSLNAACSAALQAGASGAKLTGAGGGGCIIAVCHPERISAVSTALTQAGALRVLSVQAGVHLK